MNGNNDNLIQLNGVTKVFLTEEIETHALRDVAFPELFRKNAAA
jgi:hypothetical protein